MSCEHIIDQFLSHLTGDLDAEAAAAVEAHVASCASCREATESLRALWAGLDSMPQERPSEVLRARFYAMLAAEREQAARRRPHLGERLNGWLEGWWPRQPVWQLAVALVFLAGGLAFGPRLRGSHGEIAQLRSEIQSTRQLVAISMLQQRSSSERLQGVSYSYRLDQPDADVLSALLQTLDTDPNVNVRLAAADALAHFPDQPTVRQGLLQSLSRQQSPLVQIALIDLLVKLQEHQSVDVLRQLTQDPLLNQTVRRRAEWGLQHLL